MDNCASKPEIVPVMLPSSSRSSIARMSSYQRKQDRQSLHTRLFNCQGTAQRLDYKATHQDARGTDIVDNEGSSRQGRSCDMPNNESGVRLVVEV